MAFLTRKLRHPVEFVLLALLCAFLPLLEAPKNVAWLAYVAAWVVNRARDRSGNHHSVVLRVSGLSR